MTEVKATCYLNIDSLSNLCVVVMTDNCSFNNGRL